MAKPQCNSCGHYLGPRDVNPANDAPLTHAKTYKHIHAWCLVKEVREKQGGFTNADRANILSKFEDIPHPHPEEEETPAPKSALVVLVVRSGLEAYNEEVEAEYHAEIEASASEPVLDAATVSDSPVVSMSDSPAPVDAEVVSDSVSDTGPAEVVSASPKRGRKKKAPVAAVEVSDTPPQVDQVALSDSPVLVDSQAPSDSVTVIMSDSFAVIVPETVSDSPVKKRGRPRKVVLDAEVSDSPPVIAPQVVSDSVETVPSDTAPSPKVSASVKKLRVKREIKAPKVVCDSVCGHGLVMVYARTPRPQQKWVAVGLCCTTCYTVARP